MNSCQKRILQNIADGTNSVSQGCNLRKRTKLMMPKEPLLKENSPIKKQFDVPRINIPSNSSAINNLFNVSRLLIHITMYTILLICCVIINRRNIVFLYQKCHV